MGIKKRTTAAIIGGAILFWQLIVPPIWNLNIEKFAEENDLDKTLVGGSAVNWLQSIWEYLPGSFATGFACGALIFAYWDNLSAAGLRVIGREPARKQPRGWVGSITPVIQSDSNIVSLWMKVINVGPVPFKISRIVGTLRIDFRSCRGAFKSSAFPSLAIDLQSEEEFLDCGHVATFSVKATPPTDFAEESWDVYTYNPRPSLDFRDVQIWIEGNNGEAATLQLWDSMRLSSGTYEIRGVETHRV